MFEVNGNTVFLVLNVSIFYEIRASVLLYIFVVIVAGADYTSFISSKLVDIMWNN